MSISLGLFNLLLLNLALIASIMVALWPVSLPLRNASIVDIFWGVGFVVIVWVTAFAVESMSPRGLLTSVLTSL